MRGPAVAGSIIAHALLAVALLSVHVAPAVDAPRSPIAIDVVDPPADPVVVAARGPGGGPSADDNPAPRDRSVHDPAVRDSAVRDDASPLSARADLAWTVERPGGGDGGCRPSTRATSAHDDASTSNSVSAPAHDNRAALGAASTCVGHGTGRGAGIGFGEGGAIAEPPRVPVLPAPPPASKARPPKLIYPARERDIEAARLFVARLVIDRDGFVVGARLVHGFGGPRDDQAASAVWRFRYAPALDDDGAPIDATIEQPFMVE
jgi:hypothetical protein